MWHAFWNFLDNGLFGPHTRRDTFGAALLRFLRYPYAILRDLVGGELNLRATGLVYATLLALIPALALSFAVLTAFGAHRDLEPLVLEFFRPLGDAAPRITERLMNFAENVRAGLVGVVGLALLLWTLVGTVKKMEDSFNFVWRVERARSLARRIGEYVALLIIGPLVIAAVLAFTKLALDSVASHTRQELAPAAELLRLMFAVAPYAIVTVLFTAMYLILPNTRVRLKPALIGGLAAGIVWAFTGKLFTALVIYTSRLTLVYAGFAIVVALLVWTYLGWLILLAGAQLAFYIQYPNYLRIGHSPLRLSHSEQERLALDVMLRVGQSHHRGAKPWTMEAISHGLTLPGVAVTRVVEALEEAGLLRVTDGDELYPARELAGITLEQIIDAVRSRGTHRVPHAAVSAQGVQALQAQIESAWRGACGGRTLADLVATDPEPEPHARPL